MPSFPRRASLFWLLAALFLAIGLSLAPATLLGGRLLLIGYAVRAILGLAVPAIWIGWAVGWLLLPSRWKSYELLLMPLVGIVVLVPAAYFLNYLVDMRMATLILMLAATPLALLRLRRPSAHLSPPETVIPIMAALGLLLLAIVPQLVQGSLGLLAQSGDEETYFYLARYLQLFPAGASMPGPMAPVLGQGTDVFRAEGWGYQYLLAIASTASGVDTFQAYLPTAYLLLALGVPAWYLFFREVLLLPRTWGVAVALLYSAHGLPLWFASYGYARQTAWIALAPLALASLCLALKFGGLKPTLLAGLSIACMVATESRVGITQMAVTVAGLGIYWLLLDRKGGFVLRLGAVGAVAGVAAAPALWYFVRSYLVSGEGVSILKGGQDQMAAWGPQMGAFPPIQVALGLEPEALVKIAEPIPLLRWLDPLNLAMSASSGYLAYPMLLLAALGAWFIVQKSPIAIALTAGFFVWLVVTQALLGFPYGYFKLFGVVGPILLGFTAVGALHLRDLPYLRRASLVFPAMRGRWLTLGYLLLALFLVRNTAYSFLFGARGWGLSIPPALVESLVRLGDTEPGARVYVSGTQRYPVPEDYFNLRKDHHLAMQSKEQTSVVWAERFHALAATNLVGRQIYGVFQTEQWRWANVRPDGDYDYYLLASDEDPRCLGLDQTDLVSSGDGMAFYRAPQGARAGSEQILSGRGTLKVDSSNPLVFSIGMDRIVFGQTASASGAGSGRARIALMALKETVVELQAGTYHSRLALDPGLSWYTTPTVALPATVQVAPVGGEPIRVVALRGLDPGAEELDRSPDTILSSEVTAGSDAVDVELWLSNPVRDAKGATADLAVSGQQPSEQRLSMEVSEAGQRWAIRFPAKGGGFLQLRDGKEEAGIGELSWLNSGGQLSLLFKLGHERPREVSIGAISTVAGKIAQLDRYPDPVQLRLWGYDDRPKERQMPDLPALEGTVVHADGGLSYLVRDGRRHWIPDGGAGSSFGPARALSPEQLWLIPPGRPLNGQ